MCKGTGKENKIAIVAAAGWKGAGHTLNLADRPEALLPLGDDTTIISRLVGQLKKLGFLSIVGVGRPGCLYPRVAAYFSGGNPRQERFIPENVAQMGRVVSPWTWDDIQYISGFAIPFIVPVPERGNRHDFTCNVLDAIGYGNWDKLLLIPGDFVLTSALLKDIVSYPAPCQVEMPAEGHIALLLDQNGARTYYEVIETHLGFRQSAPIAELEKAGIPLKKVGKHRADEWMDIDYGHGCEGARDKVVWEAKWKS